MLTMLLLTCSSLALIPKRLMSLTRLSGRGEGGGGGVVWGVVEIVDWWVWGFIAHCHSVPLPHLQVVHVALADD